MSGICKGVRVVGCFDCVGGGQVEAVIERPGHLCRSHRAARYGTSIIVSRSARAAVACASRRPGFWGPYRHHKVRVENGIMLVNREILSDRPPVIRISGVAWRSSDVSAPRPIRDTYRASRCAECTASPSMAGTSTALPEMDGYLGNVVGIIDFRESGAAGGGRPLVDAGAVDRPAAKRRAGKAPAHRCHHPMRAGNRLFTSATGTAVS